MADPKDTEEKDAATIEGAEGADVDTEGGRTDAPAEQEEPRAVEADAPNHRQDDDDDPGEKRRTGRTARARREAARRAKERDQAELRALRAKLAELESGFAEVRTSQHAQGIETLQNRLNEAAQRIVNAKARMELAFDADDKSGHTSATMDLMSAQREAEQLSAALDYVKRQGANGANGKPKAEPAPPRQPQASPHANPVTVALRDEFLSEHDWIDDAADTDDRDSIVMQRISDRLTQSGIPSNTARYWQLMRSEGAKALPHRFGAEGDDMEDATPQRRNGSGGPPLGGRRDAMRNGGAGATAVPAELERLMRETGQWDDPKRRAAVIADYRAGIKQQGAR